MRLLEPNPRNYFPISIGPIATGMPSSDVSGCRQRRRRHRGQKKVCDQGPKTSKYPPNLPSTPKQSFHDSQRSCQSPCNCPYLMLRQMANPAGFDCRRTLCRRLCRPDLACRTHSVTGVNTRRGSNSEYRRAASSRLPFLIVASVQLRASALLCRQVVVDAPLPSNVLISPTRWNCHCRRLALFARSGVVRLITDRFACRRHRFWRISMNADSVANCRCVIVVDDDQSTLDSMSELLRVQGFSPACFNNAHDALKAISATNPIALVTDLDMPGMSGEELCEAVRSVNHRRDLPIVALSGRPCLQSALAEGGFNRCLTKPIALHDLYSFLEDCAARWHPE